MNPIDRPRRLLHPDYETARSSVALPSPCDVDLAPQLLVVALAQAALAATHRALDRAHPILALTSRLTEQPTLSDAEELTILAMHAASQLARLLAEYAAAIRRQNTDPDDDEFPF